MGISLLFFRCISDYLLLLYVRVCVYMKVDTMLGRKGKLQDLELQAVVSYQT